MLLREPRAKESNTEEATVSYETMIKNMLNCYLTCG